MIDASNIEYRVLVSAYACNPLMGSEHGVGWGFINALSKHHHLCVIAEEDKCRSDIEAYLMERPQLRERVEFHFIKKQRGRLLRKLWPPSYYYYYRKWHESAFRLAKRLHAEKPFKLAHQLTMVGYREPGYLWKLGIPFVWGPIGGMGPFPWRFMPMLGMRGLLHYTAYNIINAWQERFARRPKIAARVAGKGLIAATPDDHAGTFEHWGQRSTLLPEVGLPGALHNEVVRRQPGEPLRIVWSGLHIPRKALNLGLLALANLPASQHWELHVLGKGYLTGAWKQLAEQLGIGDRCHFHGWVPRVEGLRIMQSGHIMLITSLRDLTSTVTVEALAQSLPIICLDHCGFSGVVDATCGIKVAVTNPRQLVQALTAALVSLENESLRYRLAQGALERAKLYGWERKAEIMDAIYRQKVGEFVAP